MTLCNWSVSANSKRRNVNIPNCLIYTYLVLQLMKEAQQYLKFGDEAFRDKLYDLWFKVIIITSNSLSPIYENIYYLCTLKYKRKKINQQCRGTMVNAHLVTYTL